MTVKLIFFSITVTTKCTMVTTPVENGIILSRWARCLFNTTLPCKVLIHLKSNFYYCQHYSSIKSSFKHHDEIRSLGRKQQLFNIVLRQIKWNKSSIVHNYATTNIFQTTLRWKQMATKAKTRNNLDVEQRGFPFSEVQLPWEKLKLDKTEQTPSQNQERVYTFPAQLTSKAELAHVTSHPLF